MELTYTFFLCGNIGFIIYFFQGIFLELLDGCYLQILREQMSRGYYRRSRSVCLVIRYMEKLKYRSLVEENILLLASLSHKRSQTLLLYWNNKNVRCPNGEWEFNFGVSLVTINYQRKDRECQGYGVNNQTQGYVSLTSKLMMVYKCFGHLWFLPIQLYCSTELISINLMRLLYWNNRSMCRKWTIIYVR